VVLWTGCVVLWTGGAEAVTSTTRRCASDCGDSIASEGATDESATERRPKAGALRMPQLSSSPISGALCGGRLGSSCSTSSAQLLGGPQCSAVLFAVLLHGRPPPYVGPLGARVLRRGARVLRAGGGGGICSGLCGPLSAWTSTSSSARARATSRASSSSRDGRAASSASSVSRRFCSGDTWRRRGSRGWAGFCMSSTGFCDSSLSDGSGRLLAAAWWPGERLELAAERAGELRVPP
jgi:hypothetical protein